MDETPRHDRWRERLAAALAPLSGTASISGYGTLISYRFGGPDPLEFVATLRRDVPEPHWLFVSHGFSEPHDDAEADGPSGYGFELTLRIPRASDDVNGEAPVGFVSLLQTLGRYVFGTGSVFVAGDYTALQDDVACLGGLTGLAFIADPELPAITTPDGTIEFRCAIGLRPDELHAIQTWTTTGFIDLALATEKLAPNALTVPGRSSFLEDSGFREQVAAGGARDGSRTGVLFLPEMKTTAQRRLMRSSEFVISVDEAGLRQALSVLPNRIAFDRALTLVGPKNRVRLQPAQAVLLEGEFGDLTIGLTADAASKLAGSLSTGAQRYAFREIPLIVEWG